MKSKCGIAVLLLIALVVPSTVVSGPQPLYFEITFLTTNDVHSRLLPWDIQQDPSKSVPTVDGVGGASRRATVIRRVRDEMSTPVLLTDSGDTTYRKHPFGGRGYQGLADVAVMNATGYDAAVLGNHDFELSGPQLRAMIEHSDFPWVCANMVNTASGETFLPPYTIKDVQGVRIAFFGLMNDVADANPALYIGVPELGLRTLPPIEVAAKLVPEMRMQADIVVLLSHLGVNPDTQLAQAVPGIDIILGAHSHTLLRTPTMVSAGRRTAFSLGAVPVVQAGAYGEYVGRTKLIFRRDPKSGEYTLMSCKGEVIHIDASIPDDPEVKGLLDKREKRSKAME